jgi:eukaryotic-like serine/threonine-protein kinase
MALKPPPQNAPAFCAFVSYSHTDERHATWLQKALERWKVPRRLVGSEARFGPIPERLGKVFLDRDELPPHPASVTRFRRHSLPPIR